jgi:hypothetical protein
MIGSKAVNTSAKPAADNKAGHMSDGSDGDPFTCAKKHILTNWFDPVKHKGEDQVTLAATWQGIETSETNPAALFKCLFCRGGPRG